MKKLADWKFPYPSQRMPVMAENVVATSQPMAAQAGLRMLAAGGNAVDAAVATAIALTVVEPTSNGLGSDAFAQVWDGTKLYGLNGSGRSPMGWSLDRFQSLSEMPRSGWDSVTVPGAVDLWAALHGRFGRLPFSDLFVPAIMYAKNGFPVSPVIAASWKKAAETFKGFEGFAETFLPKVRSPNPGEWYCCPDQAVTLSAIAESNGRDFYEGKIADTIVAASGKAGGALSDRDLATHRSDWVDPIAVEYRGAMLHEIPPNGQGLAALVALGVLRNFDMASFAVDSADSIHLQVEAMKIGFAVAGRHVADPGSLLCDPNDWLAKDFLEEQAGNIRMDSASFPKAERFTDHGTVYLTAADAAGMMVSLIQSNFMGFGSGIVIPGTGISFQNRGAGFCLEEGHPNVVAGGKRPYHTIIPGFVTSGGRPVMSFGVMGGHMQPQGHVQMMVRTFDYGQNPQTASDAPRWHLCEDRTLALEKGIPEETVRGLENKGHKILPGDPVWGYGGAQLIRCLERGYCAGSDHRKDGAAVGF